MSSKELYHFGIEGQKWGIRRFQNPDGTLTEAGKRRYSGERPTRKDKAEERRAVREVNRDRKQVARTSAYLTDQEVKDYIARLRLEKELRDLTDENRGKGKQYIKSILKDATKNAIVSAVGKFAGEIGSGGGKAAAVKLFGEVAKSNGKKPRNKEDDD